MDPQLINALVHSWIMPESMIHALCDYSDRGHDDKAAYQELVKSVRAVIVNAYTAGACSRWTTARSGRVIDRREVVADVLRTLPTDVPMRDALEMALTRANIALYHEASPVVAWRAVWLAGYVDGRKGAHLWRYVEGALCGALLGAAIVNAFL